MKDVSLPEWLTRQERYTPGADKDSFVDKNIIAIMGMLSRIRQQGARPESKHRAHAVYKLAFSLLVVLLVSLSASRWFVYIAVAALLCRICLMRGEMIAKILRNGLAAALFAALVLLPAGFFGNWYSIAVITPKVFVSVSVLSILSYGTRWDELTGALKCFFVPDLFIFVLDIAIKYIALLGDLSLAMLYALKLRSVGKNTSKRASLSGIAGTLFLRSREMAEEMHTAMECRGFMGEYHRPQKFMFNILDACLAAAFMAVVFLYFYMKR